MNLQGFIKQINSKGVTLIEIIIVVSIISIISSIIIADFPKIKLQLSLSRTAHKLAQDIRVAQNLSSSGNEVFFNSQNVVPKGYGIYIDINSSNGDKKYLIYADMNGDNHYYQDQDYIYKEINIEDNESGIIIKQILNGTENVSINFAPPNFDVTITNLYYSQEPLEIVLAVESFPDITRTITVNRSGFVESN